MIECSQQRTVNSEQAAAKILRRAKVMRNVAIAILVFQFVLVGCQQWLRHDIDRKLRRLHEQRDQQFSVECQ